MKYIKCRVYVYMNNVSVKNTRSAKYICDMMVTKIEKSVTNINEQ